MRGRLRLEESELPKLAYIDLELFDARSDAEAIASMASQGLDTPPVERAGHEELHFIHPKVRAARWIVHVIVDDALRLAPLGFEIGPESRATEAQPKTPGSCLAARQSS